MININFSINNPFSEQFSIVASTSARLTKHKAVEANIYCAANIVNFTVNYSVRGDHAGLRIVLGLLGYECELHIYDTRHWDYKNNCWETTIT